MKARGFTAVAGAAAALAALVGGQAKAGDVTLYNHGAGNLIDLTGVQSPNLTAGNTGYNDVIGGNKIISRKGTTLLNNGNNDAIGLNRVYTPGYLTSENRGDNNGIFGSNIGAMPVRGGFGRTWSGSVPGHHKH